MESLIENSHWIWIALGVALIAAEALAPGAVLLWFGVAAILTGLVDIFLNPSLDYQMLFFSITAIGFTVGFKLWQKRNPPSTPASDSGSALNRPGAEYIGKTLVVSEAIVNGSGRVKLADTSWRCNGPDLPLGSRVKVKAVQSGTFIVEAADE
ncbi:MAG: NfeD family protein [Salinisphaeraceae bacterium]|nr:NfeD family protein [Salinisphaeraceae bacterium]